MNSRKDSMLSDIFPEATKDSYTITGIFTLFQPTTLAEFCEKWQSGVYDKGGVAGFFRVVTLKENVVTVKFKRFLSDDQDYGQERDPLDPTEGLVKQFKAEIDDALGLYLPGYVWYYNVQGPDFAEVFEGVTSDG